MNIIILKRKSSMVAHVVKYFKRDCCLAFKHFFFSTTKKINDFLKNPYRMLYPILNDTHKKGTGNYIVALVA